MDKIVNLEERIEDREKKKQLKQYRGKIETLKKIIQCTSCHFKCAMCGLQMEARGSSRETHLAPIGLILCESCRDEFEDFLSTSRGVNRSDIFWHNQEWKDMWSAWLKYRKSINTFMDSSEFRLLLEEINSHL